MNSHSRPADNELNEYEWQRQERALHEERLGVAATDSDPQVLRYRMLARALRQPLPDMLPADFATRVAHLAEQRSARSNIGDTRFDSVLMFAGVLVFGVAAAAVMFLYGSDWLQPISATLHTVHASALHWLLALAGCVGLSQITNLWQQHTRQ